MMYFALILLVTISHIISFIRPRRLMLKILKIYLDYDFCDIS